jgi:hypothetical protein
MNRPASGRDTLALAGDTRRTGELAEPISKPGSRPADPQAFPFPPGALDDFTVRLTLTIGQCRSLHQPLSLVMLGVAAASSQDAEQGRMIERLLEAACRGAEDASQCAPAGPGRRVLVLPARDRQEAVTIARGAVERLKQRIEPLCRSSQLPACQVAAGVASAASPAKNFQAQRLLAVLRRGADRRRGQESGSDLTGAASRDPPIGTAAYTVGGHLL